MSANIAAIVSLFPNPDRSRASTSDEDEGGHTIRGRCPYDKIIAARPDAFTPEFIRFVDAVRSDPRWGPVYRGDLSAYNNDRSSADLALCGEFVRRGLNAGGIDIAVRTSALYRDKWERGDYRNRTIAMALQGTIARADVQANAKADQPLSAFARSSKRQDRDQHCGASAARLDD